MFKKLCVRIDTNLYEKMREYAFKNRCTITSIFIKAVEIFLKGER